MSSQREFDFTGVLEFVAVSIRCHDRKKFHKPFGETNFNGNNYFPFCDSDVPDRRNHELETENVLAFCEKLYEFGEYVRILVITPSEVLLKCGPAISKNDSATASYSA